LTLTSGEHTLSLATLENTSFGHQHHGCHAQPIDPTPSRLVLALALTLTREYLNETARILLGCAHQVNVVSVA